MRTLGRYVLRDEIASGGMATIHLGRLLGSAGFSRTVAVKCLHTALTKEPEFVSMLLDEAHLASRVRHPNVVQMIDVVSSENEVYLVMEYVHGESLAQLTRRANELGERMPIPVVVSVLAGMLYGLHAAHEAKGEDGKPLGIVHRDVSPQNVLVGVDGVARVFDFGVAKAASRLQSTWDGQVKGKLRYMAPEQLRSRAIDRRTDLFAAAAVLWETLTGRRLFDGIDPGAIVTQILMDEVPPPSRFVEGLPEALDAITLRGLSSSPDGRFASAREMAMALERAIPPATAREVGEWVEQVAGKSLAARAELVAAVENSTSQGGAVPRVRPDDETAPDASQGVDDTATLPLAGAKPTKEEGTIATAPHVLGDQRTPPSRRSFAWLAAVVVLALLSLVLGYRALRPETQSAAIEPPPRPEPSVSAAKLEAPPPTAVASVSEALDAGVPRALRSPVRPSVTTKPKKADCDPPFIMKNGIKEFKRQCL
jgi:eukaryotic-like serine/threonine-protein kinase